VDLGSRLRARRATGGPSGPQVDPSGEAGRRNRNGHDQDMPSSPLRAWVRLG